MVLLEISQNSLEKTYGILYPATLLKKKHWHKCFPVNFAKFLRKPFFKEDFWWLLLNGDINYKKSERDQIKSNKKQATT